VSIAAPGLAADEEAQRLHQHEVVARAGHGDVKQTDAARRTGGDGARFVPIRIAPELRSVNKAKDEPSAAPAPLQSTLGSEASLGLVEIVLGNGRVLRVAERIQLRWHGWRRPSIADDHGSGGRAQQVLRADPFSGQFVFRGKRGDLAKHRADWKRSLREHAFPVLNGKPCADIRTADVFNVLNPIWREMPVTVSRLRGRIALVLDYAAALDGRTDINPASWQHCLSALLPSPTKLAKPQRMAALPYQLLPKLMCKLDDIRTVDRALRWTIVTVARRGETLGATREHVDAGVEPGGRRRGEMEHPARMPGQPGNHLRMLMGGVIIEDRVDHLAGRHRPFDRVEEGDELLMRVLRHAAADHLAF
jgi:hypothetical protein